MHASPNQHYNRPFATRTHRFMFDSPAYLSRGRTALAVRFGAVCGDCEG